MKAKAPDKHDVVIAGGGLSGLALSLQLKRAEPGLQILVLEKREAEAPVATHKVGESFSELGAYYFRNVLNLKSYLTDSHIRKFGFRFFFSPEYSDDLSRRVEVGSKIFNPFPSHQVDRGRLENDLVVLAREIGVHVEMGVKVTDMDLSKSGHRIHYEKGDKTYQATGGWLVDSTGRSRLLKRKLGLAKEIGHFIHAAWFRIDAEIDIDHWSENHSWRQFIAPGLRRLSTNHLIGKGYWVWIIPLVEGRTSIGIVADPRYHPFATFNTLEKSMQWLNTHEPLAYKMFSKHLNKVMDFKVMKEVAYDTRQFYSTDKWAVTGEAGAFLDPLYSPGSDFIGLNNTWITDLVVRDKRGEDTSVRTLVYDHAHKELFRGWANLYRDMYGLFDNTQVMLMKIIWDWASYWAIPNVMFANNGYIDLDILKKYSSAENSIGKRFASLNDNMQHLFREWGKHPFANMSGNQINVFDLACLKKLQTEIGIQYDPIVLTEKLGSNLELLEEIAAEIFRRASQLLLGTPEQMKVNPYSMKLEDGKAELLKKSEAANALDIHESIRADVGKMWLIKIKDHANELA